MLLSIIICTHNRDDLLVNAIQSVLPQLVGVDAELLVVDNASTDRTREVCAEFIDRNPQFHYFYEPQPGVSYARNRGYQEARGEYIGYLDDDAIASSNWIQKALEIIAQFSPDVFGGPFLAYFRSPKPTWYQDEYGSHKITSEARRMTASEYPDAGNLFICRQILDKFGGFDIRFGPIGRKLAYGEETELVERLRIQKPDCLVYYDPDLTILHLVPEQKMHFRWIIQSNLKHGYASYFLVTHPPSKPKPDIYFRLINRIFVYIADSLIRALYRDRKRFPNIQNYWYERSINYLYEIGKLWGQIRSGLMGS
jgi:glycosyltransferase involved in cell wall biosynthesis